jgi:hypothetical protein
MSVLLNTNAIAKSLVEKLEGLFFNRIESLYNIWLTCTQLDFNKFRWDAKTNTPMDEYIGGLLVLCSFHHPTEGELGKVDLKLHRIYDITQHDIWYTDGTGDPSGSGYHATLAFDHLVPVGGLLVGTHRISGKRYQMVCFLVPAKEPRPRPQRESILPI